MKKMKIGLTAIALLMGVVSVFASKVKAIVTTYTDGNGGSLSAQYVATNCTSNVNFCANKYVDGSFSQTLLKP